MFCFNCHYYKRMGFNENQFKGEWGLCGRVDAPISNHYVDSDFGCKAWLEKL